MGGRAIWRFVRTPAASPTLTRSGLRLLLAFALGAAGLAAACGGDDNSSDTTDPPAPKADTTEQRPEATEGHTRQPGARGKPYERWSERALEKATIAGDKEAEKELEAREREDEREEDREFNKAFDETPFQKLVFDLPIRKPPLYVEQYIVADQSHKLYTAVKTKRFLCDMTLQQRKTAIEAFYQNADSRLRAGGINDFVQVVTPLNRTPGKLPALAVARQGVVSLTQRGSARDPC